MKTVIAGLEEGLNAIAEALEGGGGEGGGSGLPDYDSDPQTSDDLNKFLAIDEAEQGTILKPTWRLPRVRTYTTTLSSSDIIEDDKSGTYYFDCSEISVLGRGGDYLGFMPLCDPSYIDEVSENIIYLTSAGHTAIMTAGSLKVLCYAII